METSRHIEYDPDTIYQVLMKSEPDHYGEETVSISSEDREVFVISDLHMAAGLNVNGNYDGTENFFADASFSRFITNLNARTKESRKGLLIINGDFVDFLRIRNFPESAADFTEWKMILLCLGISKTAEELCNSIIKKERRYGLRTDDYKSVWKLHICWKGHEQTFNSLAVWLMAGNKLIIVKGNHDLEWYWKKVRDYLRYSLALNISAIRHEHVEEVLENIILPQILFVDDKLKIDDKVYIEHGHRYEHFTVVDGPPVLKNSTELNLPFGSFFNRYLINRIELAFPFINDVRPRQQILPLLIRERFPLALKMLFRYIPFTLRIIPKKKYAFALEYLFQFFLIVLIPLAVTGFAIYETYIHRVPSSSTPSKTSFLWQTIMPQIKNLVFLSLSYFLGRLFSFLQLSAPSSFYPNALKIFKSHARVDLITFGHTHDPEQKKSEGRRYYNTGTWIPVYELDAANIRLDRTYTFLQFSKDKNGDIKTGGLMRWNDDAGRIDALELHDSI